MELPLSDSQIAELLEGSLEHLVAPALREQVERLDAEGHLMVPQETAFQQRKAAAFEDIISLERQKRADFVVAFEALSEVLPQFISILEYKAILQEVSECMNKNADILLGPSKLSRKENGSLQSTIGLSDEAMFLFYKGGHSLCEQGRYKEAARIFELLTFINPYVNIYWYALGLSQHHMEEYENALHSYAMAALIDPTDINARYNAAKVYLAINEPQEAKAELQEMAGLVAQKKQAAEWNGPMDLLMEICNKAQK